MAGCNWRKHYEFIIDGVSYTYPNIEVNKRGYPNLKSAYEWLKSQINQCKCSNCGTFMDLRLNCCNSIYDNYDRADGDVNKPCSATKVYVFDTSDQLCKSCERSLSAKSQWNGDTVTRIANNERLINLWKDENYIAMMRDNSSRLLTELNNKRWSDPDYVKRMMDPIRNYRLQISSPRFDRDKPTHLYYSELIDEPDVYKIDITNDLLGRNNYMHNSDLGLRNIVSIRLFDNRYQAALCEYEIKCKYCIECTETINKDKLLEVIEHVNSFNYDSSYKAIQLLDK